MDQDARLAACNRRNRRLRGLVRTAALLNSSLDIGEILQTTLDTATGVMEAEASSVLLIEEGTGDLVYETMHCNGEPDTCRAIDELTRGHRLPRGEGIAGWVAQTGEPLLVPDAYEEPRWHPGVDEQTGFRTRSILAVPLTIHGQVIGVAEVINRKDGEAFDQEDLELFGHFCDLAAVAIEKAQLHKSQLEKEALDRELAAAREIQAAFLPRTLPEIPGYRFGRRYESAQAVGGDFYDLLACQQGTLGLVVGDVAGKGVSAALLGASVARDLRLLLRERRPPAEVARRANEVVAERSVRGKFVTLLIATMDLKTGEGTFVSCGHQPPLHYEAAAGKARYLEQGLAPPAGVLPDAPIEEGCLGLAPGDRLVLFTDGIAEAMNEAGEIFGLERLKRVVEEGAAGEATLEESVARALETFRAGSKRGEDDQTYLEVLRLPSA
jgi:sigma-B regulation protein RsbU (phosphoserine phosphatase)